MSKTKITGMDAYLRELKSSLTTHWIDAQTKALLEYAEGKIRQLGDRIQAYHSKNHMDRTGHLLNSLCWIVTYKDEVKGSGFYRDEVLHSKGIDGSSQAWLHEFWPDYAIPVYGREFAKRFIEKESKVSSSGWRVVFAILAPYWGYWERGFRFKPNYGDGNTVFLKFAVMTEFYDEVKKELKPKEIKFTVSDVTKSGSSSKRAHTKKRLKKWKEEADLNPHDYSNPFNGRFK